MIDKATIANACVTNDIATTQGSFAKWAQYNEINVDDLAYVADQRALRIALVIDGVDIRNLPQWKKHTVELSGLAKGMMPSLAATWVDGFAAGLLVGRGERNDPRDE